MPKRIFTQFLISQNVAILSWLVMFSSRPNWYWTQAVCNQSVFFSPKNCYYFSDLETHWLQSPKLKSSSSDLTWSFMAPVGPLKIKTGFRTSYNTWPIDHQMPALVPDWPIQCQRLSKCLFIDIKQMTLSLRQRWLVNKSLQQPLVYSLSLHGVYWRKSWSSGNHW